MTSPDAYSIDTDRTRAVIASNLAAELKRQRWTGRSAASALGLSQPYVSRRLTGDTELSGSDLALFAGFLKVPVSRFFVELPDLDSNQEPSHSKPAPASLAEHRAKKAARNTPPVTRTAIVTPLRIHA